MPTMATMATMATPLATPRKKFQSSPGVVDSQRPGPTFLFSPSSIGGVAMVAMVGINAHQHTSGWS